MIQALLTGSIATLFGAGLVVAVMTYLAGTIILCGALGWSLFVIIRTVRPSLGKIRAALRGSDPVERDQAA